MGDDVRIFLLRQFFAVFVMYEEIGVGELPTVDEDIFAVAVYRVAAESGGLLAQSFLWA